MPFVNTFFSFFSMFNMFFHSAEFRYEGIMLIHKNSSIRSLSDLRGKKSCHTGYGRNVGYKIPITKLRKHGIIQISTDQYLPSLERELKGLSELFTQSCIVGRFSPNDEINRLYSKIFYFFLYYLKFVDGFISKITLWNRHFGTI